MAIKQTLSIQQSTHCCPSLWISGTSPDSSQTSESGHSGDLGIHSALQHCWTQHPTPAKHTHNMWPLYFYKVWSWNLGILWAAIMCLWKLLQWGVALYFLWNLHYFGPSIYIYYFGQKYLFIFRQQFVSFFSWNVHQFGQEFSGQPC